MYNIGGGGALIKDFDATFVGLHSKPYCQPDNSLFLRETSDALTIIFTHFLLIVSEILMIARTNSIVNYALSIAVIVRISKIIYVN